MFTRGSTALKMLDLVSTATREAIQSHQQTVRCSQLICIKREVLLQHRATSNSIDKEVQRG